jgi:hypothetical protein
LARLPRACSCVSFLPTTSFGGAWWS